MLYLPTENPHRGRRLDRYRPDERSAGLHRRTPGETGLPASAGDKYLLEISAAVAGDVSVDVANDLFIDAGETPALAESATADLFVDGSASSAIAGAAAVGLYIDGDDLAAVAGALGSDLFVDVAATAELAAPVDGELVLEALASGAIAGGAGNDLFLDADGIALVSGEGLSELVLESSVEIALTPLPPTGVGRPSRRRPWRPSIPLRPRRRVWQPEPVLVAVELHVAGELVLEASADVRVYGDPREREQAALLELALL